MAGVADAMSAGTLDAEGAVAASDDLETTSDKVTTDGGVIERRFCYDKRPRRLRRAPQPLEDPRRTPP